MFILCVNAALLIRKSLGSVQGRRICPAFSTGKSIRRALTTRFKSSLKNNEEDEEMNSRETVGAGWRDRRLDGLDHAGILQIFRDIHAHSTVLVREQDVDMLKTLFILAINNQLGLRAIQLIDQLQNISTKLRRRGLCNAIQNTRNRLNVLMSDTSNRTHQETNVCEIGSANSKLAGCTTQFDSLIDRKDLTDIVNARKNT